MQNQKNCLNKHLHFLKSQFTKIMGFGAPGNRTPLPKGFRCTYSLSKKIVQWSPQWSFNEVRKQDLIVILADASITIVKKIDFYLSISSSLKNSSSDLTLSLSSSFCSSLMTCLVCLIDCFVLLIVL